jgi:hypothetical protein
MISSQRLDGGKNDVGIAIVQPSEGNLLEQILPAEKLLQKHLVGVEQEPPE